ncbi:MAG: CPBP family intramembrane metalloprotease [Anaerolineales bacterium]|nr:CPBP family intramembrane metalloprotease [Anaerolineales bacterium]
MRCGPAQARPQWGGLAVRVISSRVLLARLGWLRSAGPASLDPWWVWGLLPLPVAYAAAAAAFALAGRVDLNAFGAVHAGALMFIAAAACLEDLAFRGLMLHGFVSGWGGTPRNRAVSVVAAALLFAGMHLLDGLSGRPMLNVFFQSGQAVVLGVWLGALMLRTGSQYPAVAFHVLFNLAGYQLSSRQGLEPAPAAWLLLAALLLPLAAIGIGWLRAAPRRQAPGLGLQPSCLPAESTWHSGHVNPLVDDAPPGRRLLSEP